MPVWASSFSLAATNEIPIGFFSTRYWNVLLPWVRTLTKMSESLVKQEGFPHSEISGSKVAWHLPEAYRSFATSFIASLESRHPPYALTFLLGNVKTTFYLLTTSFCVCVTCSFILRSWEKSMKAYFFFRNSEQNATLVAYMHSWVSRTSNLSDNVGVLWDWAINCICAKEQQWKWKFEASGTTYWSTRKLGARFSFSNFLPQRSGTTGWLLTKQ